VAKVDLASAPACRELQPREGIDRHRVRIDAPDLAEGDHGVAGGQQSADPIG
jgi:hypothetical protein